MSFLETVEADRHAVELLEHAIHAISGEQAVADHRHAVTELACALNDSAQRDIDEWLAAGEADLRIAFGAQHLERAAHNLGIERRALLRVGLRVAVQAGEVAEPSRMQMNDAVG